MKLALKTIFASFVTLALSAQLFAQVDSLDAVAGFERVQVGAFERIDSKLGTWIAGTGHSIVDHRHAKSGKQCLQLTGGKQTSVVLSFAESVNPSGVLSFWAERWTAREPFSFRIEQQTEQGREEIYRGDKSIRVGRAFLNHVKVPLNGESRRLRFTVSSPPNTGILMDDVRVAPAENQKITSVKVVPFTLPALIDAPSSPLAKISVTTSGSLNPIRLTGLDVQLKKTTSIENPVKSIFASSQPGGQYKPTLTPTTVEVTEEVGMKLDASFELAEGENVYWVNGLLNKNINIDETIGVVVTDVQFSNGRVQIEESEKGSQPVQRVGVAVRNAGDDGVHTYRIPGLATTNQGTLIGVYDVRRRGGGDLPGDIDVGMSRSTDGGRTWEPMKIIMDMGEDPAWRYDGIGDPSILVDQNTGTIWVAATWSHGNRSWRGSGPGIKPEETGQLMLVRSDDDGIHWSTPINITAQIKKPKWSFILQGPGKGITMHDGTLVFPAQFQDPPDPGNPRTHRLPHSTIIYSKDHGKSWAVGNAAFDDTTESQVIEIEPGVLMLNCRYNRKSTRVVMITRDLGQTWTKHETSERSLIEPRACMASLIHVDRELGNGFGGWVLFSNPDSVRGRKRITIKASPDSGLTWPKQHRLLLDEHASAGYSCMTMIDRKTVGILYEGSQAQMTFQRIPLADLVDRQASEPKTNAPKPTEPTPQTKSGSLQLSRVFADHMVLQSGVTIPVWGQARPGTLVKVRLGSEIRETMTQRDGRWRLRLSSQPPTGVPTTMSVESGEDRIEFRDVLIGEVWVCAGQSNMEWPLNQTENGMESLKSADCSMLRLFHLQAGVRGTPGSYQLDELSRLHVNKFFEGGWQKSSVETAGDFSAVAWFFGRYLQRELNVPVGLICPAVGGTPTESWIARSTINEHPELRAIVAGNWLDNPVLGDFCRQRGEQNLLAAIQRGDPVPGDAMGPNHSFKPGFMWSAGIEPLIPFAFRGVIWYQGESNAESAKRVHQHAKLFPVLVKQWRKSWNQGDFPFLYVQLPAMNRPHWPMFRDQQRRMLSRLPHVGMAITIDTGKRSDVHPRLKKPVGERLAKWALGTTYRKKKYANYSGPLFQEAVCHGDTMNLNFLHHGKGLQSSDGQPLRHFEIAGKDRRFYPAVAKIIAPDMVSVSSVQVLEPRYVRYAWQPFPQPPVNFTNIARIFQRHHSPQNPAKTKTYDENQNLQQKKLNDLLTAFREVARLWAVLTTRAVRVSTSA